MSNGEIKTLETDVVIFPIKFANKSDEQVSDETEKIEPPETRMQPQNIAKQKTNVFARWRKSVRKKSISIL